MKVKTINFSTVYNQGLVKNIFKILKDPSYDSCSMLEISQALGNEYKEGSVGWKNLRLHLIYLAQNGYIEERHFGKIAADWEKRVDYVIEPKGMKESNALV